MFDELIDANRVYADNFPLQDVAPIAAKHFCLVTCMDSRIAPLASLGLVPGDAKILRNAGGRVTDDVLRSLVLATSFLSVTHVAVMQHTDCALANRTEADVVSHLPASQANNASDWQFLAMPDPDACLRSDVERIRTCAVLPDGVLVEGWRYDVRNGRITQVVVN